MNLGIELVLANGFTALFNATLDASRLADCPPVSFADPMAWDEAHRLITFCPTLTNAPEHPGSFLADVQIMVKSQWTQPDASTDISAHFARVNDVRNLLLADDLTDRLSAVINPDDLGIDHVNKGIRFTTALMDGNWITSEAQLQVRCHNP